MGAFVRRAHLHAFGRERPRGSAGPGGEGAEPPPHPHRAPRPIAQRPFKMEAKGRASKVDTRSVQMHTHTLCPPLYAEPPTPPPQPKKNKGG